MIDNVVTENDKQSLESASGVLKFFLSAGYGFISRTGSADVFVHINALKRSGIAEAPPVGTKLAFDLEPMHGKPPQAVNIRIVE